MARHWYGQTPTDWTMSTGSATYDPETETSLAAAFVRGPVTITFWNAPIGGTQYTDLLDASGSAITEVKSADGTTSLPLGTIPQFQGPDGAPVGPAEMWADAGGGVRYLMVATDLGGDVTELQSTVADLIGTVTALTEMVQNSMGAVVCNAGTSSWPERPAGDSRLFQWVGPSVPTAGAPYMEEGDLWVNTSAA